MNLDLNQIISAALSEAIREALKPLTAEMRALEQTQVDLQEQVRTLKNQTSCIDRDLTEAQNQINCLKETPATAGVDYAGVAFQEAVELVADRRIEGALERFTKSDEFGDAAKIVADERINRKMAAWTELPEFEDGIKEVVKEWFEDEIEVKDLIEPAVELILEDVDFNEKIEDALKNEVTLRVVVE